MKTKISFSYLRVISALAIVMLHTVSNASQLFKGQITQTAYSWSSVVVRLLMWAVPCFVMATGALLLDKKRDLSIRKLYGKYVLRIVLAIVLFFILYQLYDLITSGDGFTFIGMMQSFQKMFTGQSWGHVWYLYLLLGLYILMPIYRLVSKNATDKEIRYLLLAYFIFLALLPTISVFGLTNGLYIHVSTIYPFYLFAGYAIHNKIIKIPKTAAVVVLITCFVLTAVFTLMYSKDESSTYGILLGYNSVLVAIESLCMFTLFDSMNGLCERIDSVISCIDKRTFGIYMVHPFFTRLFYKYLGYDPYDRAVPAVLVFMILAALFFAVSFLITVILQKIPGVKRIV